MRYIADLHIHSPFSRATSKLSTLSGLASWAKVKGIDVVGTGDFTHPGWFARLKEELEPAEPGFFKLKQNAVADALQPGKSTRTDCRFVLTAEISSIYKRHDRVRKIHNILYAPDFASVERLNSRLAAIGNIESDGRPILGLDSYNLLQLFLDLVPQGFLVPAHIWTPWFSLFGSKSGFDSIEECFGDLSTHIFALETGLSSDPDMNRLISALDRFTLISNSDCHSPSKLGREANILTTGFDYFSMREALKKGTSDLFHGTVEFFPEEGKYHYDGHRKCDICFTPAQSRDHDNICPVCGRPLTIGVMNRVMELADRQKPYYPQSAPAVYSLIPLAEIVGEIINVGPASKAVQKEYSRLISLFGSEFNLLLNTPIDEIREQYSPVMAEAVKRMRTGRVIRNSGYDGEFGVIKVFEEGELDSLAGQISLFGTTPRRRQTKKRKQPPPIIRKTDTPKKKADTPAVNQEQQEAIQAPAKHLLITAGPGTGKTYTLISRIIFLLEKQQAPAHTMTVITFTNKAAEEVRDRVGNALPDQDAQIFIGTFHAFCLQWLRRCFPELKILDQEERISLVRKLYDGFLNDDEINRFLKNSSIQLNRLGSSLFSNSEGKQFVDHSRLYFKEMMHRKEFDLDAIIPFFVACIKTNSDFLDTVRQAVAHLFVDEFQDLNFPQYELVQLLAETAPVFAIGDPDQAIYGFRGSSPEYFLQFINDFNPHTVNLSINYRSTPSILKAAHGVIRHNALKKSRPPLTATRPPGPDIQLYQATTGDEEAEFIVKQIEKLMGGISHFSINSGRGDHVGMDIGFSDIAILYRLSQQAVPLSKALTRRGIPFQVIDVVPFFMAAGVRVFYYWLQVATSIFLDKTLLTSDLLPLLQDIPGIGNASIQSLRDVVAPTVSREELQATRLPVSEKVNAVLKQLQQFINDVSEKGLAEALIRTAQYLNRADQDEDITRLIQLGGAFGKDLAGFAAHLLKNNRQTIYDEDAEAVTLLTLHGSKGLEFPVVFMAGVEEGLLPCSLFADKSQPEEERDLQVEEERRLFFVGMTRAKEQLILSYSQQRGLFGAQQQRQMSRFIKEIPEHLLQQSRGRRKVKKAVDKQLKLF